MPDDPFADPGVDRTVIMPMPGGRAVPGRPAPAEQRATPAEQAEASEATAVGSGLNPLLAAANRLLNVLPQLRSSVQHPNPTALRDSLAQGIRQFEAQARTAGVPTEKIMAARYALCTLIDETATSTPLGASGAWAHQGLLALFHGETGGGEKFFQLLARLAENPQANLELLELLYVCLEFGFEGRYRVTEGGQRQLEAIRQRLLMIIRKQRGEYERELSPNWRGVSAASQRRLGWMPLWVVGAVSALLLVVIYVGFEWRLSRASDTIAADIAALRVAAPVPPPAGGRAAAGDVPGRGDPARARHGRRPRRSKRRDHPGRRAVQARRGHGRQRRPVAPEPHRRRAQARAGAGRRDRPHDNIPIRTLRFPSNWELSKARAESVARLIAASIGPARVRYDGRGDSEPVTPERHASEPSQEPPRGDHAPRPRR